MTTIVVLGSLDTKAAETAFLAQAIKDAGAAATVIDTSAGGGPAPQGAAADVAAAQLAEEAGVDLASLAGMDRAEAVRLMADAAADHIARRVQSGTVDGVISAGGSNAALIFAETAQRLPFGVPKVVVTTMATVDAQAVIGDADVTMIYPVVDIDGLNTLSRTVLAQAGAAVVAMAGVRHFGFDCEASRRRRVVAASMFGVTTPCVQAVRARLEANDVEVVVFHATGTGGRSMEALASSGAIDVIVDVTTTELADLYAGGTLSAGADRLTAGRSVGVPRVIVPGAIDMANFGGLNTIPQQLKDRLFHVHNDNVSLMRTNVAENELIGRHIGAYCAARDDAVVLLPLRGISALDKDGGPFWWPDANAAAFNAIRNAAPDEVIEVDAHINDDVFAERLTTEVTRLTGLPL